MLLELKAVYSNQKGFYGKACVHEVNSHITMSGSPTLAKGSLTRQSVQVGKYTGGR